MTTASTPPAPALDWQGLERRYAGHPDSLARLVRIGIEANRDVPGELRALADAADLPRLRSAAHSIRGGAQVLLAAGVEELSAQLEFASGAGDAAAVGLACELADAVAELVAALSARAPG